VIPVTGNSQVLDILLRFFYPTTVDGPLQRARHRGLETVVKPGVAYRFVTNQKREPRRPDFLASTATTACEFHKLRSRASESAEAAFVARVLPHQIRMRSLGNNLRVASVLGVYRLVQQEASSEPGTIARYQNVKSTRERGK